MKGKEKTFKKNQLIIKEGEKENLCMYHILEGSVRVFLEIRGRKVELAQFRAGDFFGEIGFLTGTPRTASVETLEECKILEISDINEFGETTEKDIFLRLLKDLATRVARADKLLTQSREVIYDILDRVSELALIFSGEGSPPDEE